MDSPRDCEKLVEGRRRTKGEPRLKGRRKEEEEMGGGCSAMFSPLNSERRKELDSLATDEIQRKNWT
jgi:hypothetical protein